MRTLSLCLLVALSGCAAARTDRSVAAGDRDASHSLPPPPAWALANAAIPAPEAGSPIVAVECRVLRVPAACGAARDAVARAVGDDAGQTLDEQASEELFQTAKGAGAVIVAAPRLIIYQGQPATVRVEDADHGLRLCALPNEVSNSSVTLQYALAGYDAAPGSDAGGQWSIECNTTLEPHQTYVRRGAAGNGSDTIIVLLKAQRVVPAET